MFFANLCCLEKNDLKHFALMIDGEVITPYEIEKYYMQCNGVLPLEANGKAGMLAYDLGLIYIKSEYDELYDDGFGSDFTFVKDGKKVELLSIKDLFQMKNIIALAKKNRTT